MAWLLTLHIAALLCWGAAQLYLPTLIAAARAGEAPLSAPARQRSMAQFLFTHVSSPAALLAIFAGTLIFLVDRTVEAWLLAKLSLVSLLAFAHVFTGLLLLRMRHHPERPVRHWCFVIAGASFVLMAAIIAIVLAKPAAGIIP